MKNNFNRRAFIAHSLKAGAAAALLQVPGAAMGQQPRKYTVKEVIDTILKEVPGAPFKTTVDTIKSGSMSQPVAGIVTTMFATVQVIEEAARRKANFIIAHEPTFYNHQDDVNYVPNSAVVKQKQALLEKHNITVWRFHDYWHAVKPDGIGYGVLKKAGWVQYYKPGSRVLQMPSQSLREITGHLKTTLNIPYVRAIGDMQQPCLRVALMPGAAGGQAQISLLEQEKPDVLIVGEVHEWETAEYVRDARQLGAKTALVVLGHCVSEEPGMEWLVNWLRPKVPGLPVAHVPSESPFTWV
ncbi:MAG TPA: Nif3-like dinuclear metal center hexameric protein [Chitinophaga sp.]|uniref:Nif3-like dinuclear metal center hexameric protein n=1 Tax=Chitinophaga sp. TaxID=1869181 RepID=UPI002DBDB1BC|nr:Nif3-like dinuclear metal center hexameric protein [Chitinophaga sp.]HEU4552882.1 Nif3-like dinuclear metal center hexameric protein [Chitinophaga sp.]